LKEIKTPQAKKNGPNEFELKVKLENLNEIRLLVKGEAQDSTMN